MSEQYLISSSESVPHYHTGWVLATLDEGRFINLQTIPHVELTSRCVWVQEGIDNAVSRVHTYTTEAKGAVYVTYAIEDYGVGPWQKMLPHRTWRQLVNVWFDRLNNPLVTITTQTLEEN